MLPDLAGQFSLGEHVLGSQPDRHALRRAGQVMGAQALHGSLDEFDIHLAGGEIVDTSINNPAAFLAQPWLVLGEFEDEVKDLGPFGERGGRLEEDRRLDDCFRAEETTKMVIALFLYTRIISD